MGSFAIETLQPVLLEKRIETRSVVFDFPKDTKQGCGALFVDLRFFIDDTGPIGLFLAAGFRPCAKSEIRQRAAIEGRKLPVGNLVEQNAGFRTGTQGSPIPTEGLGRFLVNEENGESPGERDSRLA